MMSKIFLDTNILIYAVDQSSPQKQRDIRRLLRSTVQEHPKVISTQVLQEFYVAAVRKLGIQPLIAKDLLNRWLHFELVLVEGDLIKEAIDCSILNRLSFWDALIVASAEKARCSILWTEDLTHGQIIRGIRIENPFRRTTLLEEEKSEYKISKRRRRSIRRTSLS